MGENPLALFNKMYDTKCIMNIKDYYKPTPSLFRKIGDSILIGCTSISTAVMGLPISEHAKLWIVFYLNIVGVGGKIITNFFKEGE